MEEEGLKIGKMNKLRVVKELDFGIYLDGGSHGEILMPKRYVPEGTKPEDMLDVFIYFDSEDRIIATTEKPYAMVGQIACLKVVSVNKVGAFMDWGLMKDLLVPFNEQYKKLEVGNSYVVLLYTDEETERIAATARVEEYLDQDPKEYTEGQEVDLMIYNQSELGYKAIINNKHTGMLYSNEIFRKIKIGEKLKGYIKKLREDGKIDLMLDRPGYFKVTDISTQILNKLKEQNGFIAIGDKSPAEEIYNMFGISKKAFKMTIGGLYKSRLITIEKDGIKLV
jgi:predicted RNA-binding protein (virulence factor B family)